MLLNENEEKGPFSKIKNFEIFQPKNTGDSDSEVFYSFEMVGEESYPSRRAEIIPLGKLKI